MVKYMGAGATYEAAVADAMNKARRATCRSTMMFQVTGVLGHLRADGSIEYRLTVDVFDAPLQKVGSHG